MMGDTLLMAYKANPNHQIVMYSWIFLGVENSMRVGAVDFVDKYGP